MAAAVGGAEVVITSLANDEAVVEVALGEGGVLSCLGDGAVYVEASTISPTLSGHLARQFPRFAAMPILGSPAAVAEGRAAYLIGGTAEVIAAVDPLLADLSDTVLRCDAPPMASTAKLAVNLLLLDGLVALAESIKVGRSGGLSDEQLRQLLGNSPMLAPGLKNRFEGVLTGDQEGWWSCALGAKDAGLAVEVVGVAGGELPLTAVAGRRYEEAASAGYAEDDIAAVAALYRL